MTISLAEHMRVLLNNLQEFRQLNCDYDPATRTILFTLADLQALSKAHNFPLTGAKGGYATGEDWSEVKNKLIAAGIPDDKFRGRLRVQAPHVMGITVMDDETKKLISQVLNISCTEVQVALPQTPCKWDDQTRMLLFTTADLTKFGQGWKIHNVDSVPSYHLPGECYSSMQHILTSSGVQKDQFRGRMSLPAPYVLALELKDSNLKQKVVSILRLAC